MNRYDICLDQYKLNHPHFLQEREILAILTAMHNFQINETILRVGSLDVLRLSSSHPLFVKDCRGSLTVGRLRYHASPSISNLAKEIVKDWKAVVEEERARKKVARFRDTIVGTTESPQKQTSKQGGGEMRSSTVYSGLTGDKTRNSCIEMVCLRVSVASKCSGLLPAATGG
jgi:hypothetical protein